MKLVFRQGTTRPKTSNAIQSGIIVAFINHRRSEAIMIALTSFIHTSVHRMWISTYAHVNKIGVDVYKSKVFCG
jgi:hypothetical protein